MMAGLILAAGASRRMGSPKALLEVEGRTFLDRLIALLAAHCEPVIVVLGHDAGRIRRGSKLIAQARVVVNPEPDRGQLSSLQCGLREASGCGAVMYTPVDLPLVRPSTVAALIAAAGDWTVHRIVAPEYRGCHGHPVCISRELIPEFLALPEDSTARDVIHRWRHLTVYVPVDDAGVTRDIDDPDAYQRLVGQ